MLLNEENDFNERAISLMVDSHGPLAPGAATVCSLRAEHEMPIKTNTTMCDRRLEFLHESGLQFH